MRYREVTLSRLELRAAALWGHDRFMDAVERGYQAKYGFEGDPFGIHYWGVCGEMAYARLRNVYYVPTINTYKAPDVDGVGVRTRMKHSWDLNIRPDDPDDLFFVLVTVESRAPTIFRVYGGYWAWEAKQHKEWYRTFDERPECYWVPQRELRERSGIPDSGVASLELELPPLRRVLTSRDLGVSLPN